MTEEQPAAMHTYCRASEGSDPNCIRSWYHSGDCRPGCRICNTTDHLTPNCPTWSSFVLDTDPAPADDDPEPEPQSIPTVNPAGMANAICHRKQCDCAENGVSCVLRRR